MSTWRKFVILAVAMIVLFILAGVAMAMAVTQHSLTYCLISLGLWIAGILVIILGEGVQKKLDQEGREKIERMIREDR